MSGKGDRGVGEGLSRGDVWWRVSEAVEGSRPVGSLGGGGGGGRTACG